MTEQPLVTVITVVYNIIENGRKDFLIQNFESVHNQTYKNIEHLIIDGASTDGTIDLLKKYERKGWIHFISEPDSGIFDAMNKGHKKAKGEYALVLNSDDWYASNDVIECMVKKSLETDADYVYGNQECWSLNGNHATGLGEQYIFWRYMPFNHPTIMIKNSVVAKQGYYRTDFDTVEDYRFVIQLILDDYKGVYIDKIIVNFRLGGASFDQKTLTSFYDFHYRRLAKLYMWFYSQFDDRMTEEKIIQNYMWDIGGKFDELFFIRLIRFMIFKKLKNFNYEDFFKHIEFFKNSLIISTKEVDHQNIQNNFSKKMPFSYSKYYYILGIPFMKIKEDAHGSKHYKLFSLVPIFKIKIDRKGTKTYKLFSFFPLFKIK